MEKKNPGYWFIALEGALCLLGLFLLFAISGHGFLGLLCLGIAALLAFYRLTASPGKRSRVVRAVRVAVSALVVASAVFACVPGALIYRASHGDGADCRYIIVLGAGVNGTVPSLSLRERIDAAADYLSAHPETMAVLSGGQGTNEDISEADCMFRELVARGVDPDRLWREDCAENTRENIALSLAVIEQNTGRVPEEIGVVSADYHLCRTEAYAKSQGVTAHGIPARSTMPTLWLNYFLREIVALTANWIFGV